MKRFALSIAVILSAITAVSGEELLFRGHSFATSIDAFRAAEGAEVELFTYDPAHDPIDVGLWYEDKQVAGYGANFEAGFKADVLTGGIYEIHIDDDLNPSQEVVFSVSVYRDLQHRLTQLYGTPFLRDSMNQLTHPVPFSERAEIERVAEYITRWDYGGGRISLQLEYQNWYWELILIYMSPEWLQRTRARQEERATSTGGL